MLGLALVLNIASVNGYYLYDKLPYWPTKPKTDGVVNNRLINVREAFLDYSASPQNSPIGFGDSPCRKVHFDPCPVGEEGAADACATGILDALGNVSIFTPGCIFSLEDWSRVDVCGGVCYLNNSGPYFGSLNYPSFKNQMTDRTNITSFQTTTALLSFQGGDQRVYQGQRYGLRVAKELQPDMDLTNCSASDDYNVYFYTRSVHGVGVKPVRSKRNSLRFMGDMSGLFTELYDPSWEDESQILYMTSLNYAAHLAVRLAVYATSSCDFTVRMAYGYSYDSSVHNNPAYASQVECNKANYSWCDWSCVTVREDLPSWMLAAGWDTVLVPLATLEGENGVCSLPKFYCEYYQGKYMMP